ncbi:hypothetical protein ACSTDZ_22265 [Vibrio vulnificus]|uniref:hypothetical protein n=1 Tax=Vibrio TaxID=662 RepID=UPI0009B644B8|nr:MULTISPECIES: hypothetical protein [Vibrio]OQK44255.1 hypothetical protein XM74_c11520 [Vibrio vulnificus]OQK54337.1 hypothetical protein XM76_c11599 [Vibrio vulnificus]POC22374.1 hypothetical protein CRN46_12840 [Vibrio vulnificus]TQP66915.1 hypothetical protein FLL91_16175 [Vibrio cholerae]TQQ02676.1 hypothetical protein FLL72_17810 [Vibrio cholerae]
MNKKSVICLLLVFLLVGCSSARIKVQDEGFEYNDFQLSLEESVSVILENDFVFDGMSPDDYKRGLRFSQEFINDISRSASVTRSLSDERYTIKMEIEVFEGRYRSNALAILFAFTLLAVPAPMEYDRSVKAVYYYGNDKIGEYSFEFKRQTYKGLFTSETFWEEIAEDAKLLANKAFSQFETVILEQQKNSEI